MRRIQDNIIELHTMFKRIVEESNRQDYLACKTLIKNSNEMLMEVISSFINNESVFNEIGCQLSSEYVTGVLSGILAAQENEDYVLYSDLVDLQLIPILNDLQNATRELLNNEIDKAILEINIGSLKTTKNKETEKTYKKLMEYIVKRDTKKDLECVLEPTTSGSYTLHVYCDNKDFYLHSNNNPAFEGRAFASRYYQKEISKYIVVGLSMGYHIIELLKHNRDMEIIILESNLEVIFQALSSVDLTSLLGNSNISLSYVSNLETLGKYIANEDSKLLIHRPAVKYISNKSIANKLNIILEQEDYIKRSENAFFLNVKNNIINCNFNVDNLQDEIKGNRVLIVAAGPSLDKNIHLLKEKPDGVIVIAVGTVFHKLISMGIRPDYIIITDAYTYWQVEGLENETIPMLLLATASRKIGLNYKGNKYLICQGEVEEARKYANSNNFHTYETGGSVATTALDVVVELGAKEVAFIGLDLAYPNNKAHASNTIKEHIVETGDMVKIESINGEIISTSKIFLKYIDWFEKYI